MKDKLVNMHIGGKRTNVKTKNKKEQDINVKHSSVLELENIDGNETNYAPSNDFDSPN